MGPWRSAQCVKKGLRVLVMVQLKLTGPSLYAYGAQTGLPPMLCPITLLGSSLWETKGLEFRAISVGHK